MTNDKGGTRPPFFSFLLFFLFGKASFHVGVRLSTDGAVLFATGGASFLALIDVPVKAHFFFFGGRPFLEP